MIIENNNGNIIFSRSDKCSTIYQKDVGNSYNPRRKKIEIKRQLIVTAIEQDPGITYKDLLRMTAVSNGSLSWNVKVLETQKKVRVSRSGNGNTHLYPVYLDEHICSLLTEIRRKKTKEIIFVLLAAKGGCCTVKEISTAIKKAPTTTWWHLKRMHLKGIVFKKLNKKTSTYGLLDRDIIINLLSNYSSSKQIH